MAGGDESLGRGRALRLGLLQLGIAALVACGHGSTGVKGGGLTPYPDVSSTALDQAHQPRRLALLVGVDHFDDTAFRPLRFASRDARELGAVLLDPGVGAFDDVVVRTDAASTRVESILASLDALKENVRDPRDTVLVYISTHGTLAHGADGRLQSYLVGRDSRIKDVASTSIPMREFRRRFEALPSSRKVLVLATCHSGRGKSALSVAMQEELEGTKSATFFAPPLEEVSEASVVLSACAWGETAREDKNLGHDIYTHFLLEALRKVRDRNGDGAVTASEAHEYAMAQTYNFSAGRQRPTAHSDILGVDPIVLSGKKQRPGRPALVGYGSRWEGVKVQVDGTEKGVLPGSVLLEPGVHEVQLSRGGTAQPIVATEVELVPGQRLDLASLLGDEAERPSVGLFLGGQGFLASDARSDLFGAGPLIGLEARWPGWPAEPWVVGLDIAWGRREAQLTPGGVPIQVQQQTLMGGVGLYRRGWLGPLRLHGGPRLDAMSLSRQLEERDGLQVSDGVFSFGAGVAGGVAMHVGAGLWLAADARLSLVYVRVDDVALNLTNGVAFLGVRYGL